MLSSPWQLMPQENLQKCISKASQVDVGHNLLKSEGMTRAR
jgi:hypothetical protein